VTEPEADAVDSDRRASAPPDVRAVSLVVALYGLAWVATSLLGIYDGGDPSVGAAGGVLVGVALIALADGLRRLRWPAWALAVVLLVAVLAHETLQLSRPTLDAIPFVPAFVLLYLVSRQPLFFAERHQSA
jgi:hypothetical protein